MMATGEYIGHREEEEDGGHYVAGRRLRTLAVMQMWVYL